MTEQDRTQVAHYLNTTPALTSDAWDLLGEGISSGQMDYGPQNQTNQYVHEKVATTRVTGYQPTFPVEQIVYPGDDLFDAIDAIRQAGPSIGSNDITELVEVRLYEDADTAGTSYPATLWNIGIQIDTGPGGDGGADATMSYTLNIQGDPTEGDFNTTTLAWTADS